ncbi:hypothetical protein PanWU01x14_255470 [Parasponia andersonii]|uniref:Uncharacterized protein n=1 Tax=Parasponia andersonii TaxID=3476 RepID=A0A2P5BAQ6_PARAD|nr:hypothetical protein PanWU01x14_255470 [Parasponia andersonii]
MGLIHPSSEVLAESTWCAWVCVGSVTPPLSNKTSMFSSMPPIDAFLASVSALWFSSLGICSILKLAKRALAPITLEKYLCSLGSFTSKSPLTWPAINCESVFTAIFSTPKCNASSRPCNNASYSASLLVAWNLSLSAFSTLRPVGVCNTIPTPDPEAFVDPSVWSVHVEGGRS